MCKDIFQRLQRDLPPWLGFAIISCIMQNPQNGSSFNPWGICSEKNPNLNLHTKAKFTDIHNTAHKISSGERKSGLVNLKNKPGQWKQATIKDQRIHKLTETIIATTDVQQPRSWENLFGSRILLLGASILKWVPSTRTILLNTYIKFQNEQKLLQLLGYKHIPSSRNPSNFYCSKGRMQNLERPPNASAVWPGDSQRLLGNNKGEMHLVLRKSAGDDFSCTYTKVPNILQNKKRFFKHAL